MHGQPDFGMYAPKVTVAGLSDMAELAARLGSIVTFDRRGDVVWLDDFEDNIGKWGLSPAGTGAAIELSTDTAKNGAKSCKITCGNAVGDDCYIARYPNFPIFSNLGFEFSFAYYIYPPRLDLELLVQRPTTFTTFDIRYDVTTKTLSIYDKNGNYVTLDDDLPLAQHRRCFHTMKLVCDLTIPAYKRLLVNERSYDLSAYDMPWTASITTPSFSVKINAKSLTAWNSLFYIDDVIITQNEP